MATKLFNALTKIGVVLAVTGGVVQSALSMLMVDKGLSFLTDLEESKMTL